MTTGLAIAFLVSLAGMGALAIYGVYVLLKDMIRDKEWGPLAFVVCALIFGVSATALNMLGFFPESVQ